MASWVLVPCLVQLRTELNQLAPNRDKSSDGTIGDAAHQDRVSDHNDDEVGRVPIRDADSKHEVHAVDLDADLREPGLTLEMVVQHVVGRCRSGKERRLRYVIYRRRIWEASNGWKQQDYDGDNAHEEHAHFSSSYVTELEASTASWALEEIPVALTETDKKWLVAQISAVETRLRAEINAVPTEDLALKIGDKANPARSNGDLKQDLAKLRGLLVGDRADTANAKLDPTSPLARIINAADKVLAEKE
jgi:hypothetical protein